jgi:hypothetical protein
MRKIRLDPEDLVVEAFPTTGRMHGRGTVRGYASEFPCDSADCTAACGSDGVGCTEACDPVPSGGFDPNSVTACAGQCHCPLLLGTAGQTARC